MQHYHGTLTLRVGDQLSQTASVCAFVIVVSLVNRGLNSDSYRIRTFFPLCVLRLSHSDVKCTALQLLISKKSPAPFQMLVSYCAYALRNQHVFTPYVFLRLCRSDDRQTHCAAALDFKKITSALKNACLKLCTCSAPRCVLKGGSTACQQIILKSYPNL